MVLDRKEMINIINDTKKKINKIIFTLVDMEEDVDDPEETRKAFRILSEAKESLQEAKKILSLGICDKEEIEIIKEAKRKASKAKPETIFFEDE
ncbi:MAG: hypothetical protein KDK54_19745 [Leptospiraceae bacterium]|nr:hypothetical protein [Leptospiraceae bacterium]